MKKTIAAVLILLVFGIGIILTPSIKLEKQYDRGNDYILNSELKYKINSETHGMDEMEILNYSIKTSGDYLEFAEKNNINDHKANCVGYAKLCSCICNYALSVNNMSGYAKPVVGYPKFSKVNICHILKYIAPKKYKAFVKNHDFVEFSFGNGIIYADPCAYDLIGTDCTTFKSNKPSPDTDR